MRLWSLYASTLPFDLSILSRSIGSSGLWSFDKGTASQVVLLNLPNTALESPVLVHMHCLPRIRIDMAVEPLKLESMFGFLHNSL